MMTGTKGSTAAMLVAVLLALAVGALSPNPVGADHDIGPTEVYFPQTGHTLRGDFLDHWRHYGGLPIFGYPLTEEITNSADGVTRQYFERAVFELNPAGEGAWAVLLQRLGAELTKQRSRTEPFRPLPPVDASNCGYYAETGHRLCNGFREYWEEYGGLPIFGYPLSEEFTENGRTVQYFERARFEWHPENGNTIYQVLLGHLGRDAAGRDDVKTASIPKPEGTDEYSPDLWYVPVYIPVGAPTYAAYWIEVDLSAQYMTAWEYDAPILGTYVSTGTWDYPTPTGYFEVFTKLRYDDMTNGLAAPPGEYYYVEDVPHVMYFAAGGYAIHGAYWHSMFGTPFSHGCVSTPLWAAEWFYNWAPYGTVVWIHE